MTTMKRDQTLPDTMATTNQAELAANMSAHRLMDRRRHHDGIVGALGIELYPAESISREGERQ